MASVHGRRWWNLSSTRAFRAIAARPLPVSRTLGVANSVHRPRVVSLRALSEWLSWVMLYWWAKVMACCASAWFKLQSLVVSFQLTRFISEEAALTTPWKTSWSPAVMFDQVSCTGTLDWWQRYPEMILCYAKPGPIKRLKAVIRSTQVIIAGVLWQLHDPHRFVSADCWVALP